MVAIIKRMRKLRTLLTVRLGDGAAILPPEVTRIHMDFAFKQEDGHTGARNFWRTCLRRLKYHNPAVPMTVTRSKNQSGPALLTISFASPSTAESSKPPISSTISSATSTAPVAASTPEIPTERVEIVNMKRRSESQILARVIALTNAKEVKATEDEQRQIEDIEEFRERAAEDAKRQNKVLAKMKREKEIMDRARAMVDV